MPEGHIEYEGERERERERERMANEWENLSCVSEVNVEECCSLFDQDTTTKPPL